MNVGKMWRTPETCGKLAKKCGKRVEKCLKNVDNCPKNVGNFVDKMWECGKHVENMWKTHLYVQMCKIVANYTNVSQFFFVFLFFLFFFFFFIFLLYFYNLSKIMTTIAGRGGALQLYALACRHGT